MVDLLKSLLFIAAAVVTGLSVLLYLLQDRLLFHPQKLGAAQLQEVRRTFPQAEELMLRAADGTPLHGWFVKSSTRPPAPLVIYFGGNAEEVSWLLEEQRLFEPWSLLLVNYRGFGLSGGKPGEKALLADALLIYDEITRRGEVDTTRVVAMGRSLGSGVAVHLAAGRPLRGIVLVSPYDSIARVARHHYPYVPVGLLLNHHFDSISLAPGIHIPALVLAAEHDEVVPAAHARALFEAWAGPKHWYQLHGTDHISIAEHPDYQRHIAEFLHTLE